MGAKYHVGVIGLGKFGLSFARTMVELGHRVLGVDVNPEHVKQCQHILTQTYQADATDKKTLEQIGVADLDHVLVSVGSSITASAMICMYLKELKISKVWVKAVHEDHRKLLYMIGVEEVIIPEDMAAMQLANKLSIPGFIDRLPFDSEVILKEISIDQWAGETLRRLDLTNTRGVQAVAVKRADQESYKFIPRADDVLEKGDVLVVIGHTESLAKIKS